MTAHNASGSGDRTYSLTDRSCGRKGRNRKGYRCRGRVGVTSLARIGRGGGLDARTTGDRCTDGADSQGQAGKSDWGQDVWSRRLGKGRGIIGVVYKNSRVWD